MDLPRNVRESTPSSLNGARSSTITTGGVNNASVPLLFANAGSESALPPGEAFARPRRLPTEAADVVLPDNISPSARSLHDRAAASTRPSSRIPSPIGTAYVTGRQHQLQWQPRQVYQDRTRSHYGEQDQNDNSSGMSLPLSLRLELSDQSDPPPEIIPSAFGRTMPMNPPATITSAGVTERDDVGRRPESSVIASNVTTTPWSMVNWNIPTPIQFTSARERPGHEQRRRLLQQRLNDEARELNAQREPPLPGDFVARPSSPPWITAEAPDWNAPAPATIPSAPIMQPAIRRQAVVPEPRRFTPNEPFPVVPFNVRENHDTHISAQSQTTDVRSYFGEDLGRTGIRQLSGTSNSDTSVARFLAPPNPPASRPNVVTSSLPISGTTRNMFLTISNTQLHYAEASDPETSAAMNEPSQVPNTHSRREMGTQSESSATGTTVSAPTNALRNPTADDAPTRHSPARALFLFELISAILDATSSLALAASTSSSNSSLNQIGQQASAGSMTSSSRSSSMAGFFAQYLSAAIAATNIANAEQEHYAGHGSGSSSTTAYGLGDRDTHPGRSHRRSFNQGPDHAVVPPSRYGQRDGAVLGYRFGERSQSTSEFGNFGPNRDRYENLLRSSPNDPQTRGRFAVWGNPLNRDGDVDEDWDLDDDDDLQLFYASHGASESNLDDYVENWDGWAGGGPQTESGFPSFGPPTQIIENGTPSRHEEPPHDDQHQTYLYRYHDTHRPLLSRRNRVRGGLLPGASDRMDMSGRALPLLPLHMPFSDGSVPSRSTIEILDANGILIDAPVPSNPSHADLHGDGSESSMGLFRFVRPVTRGGLTMTAPLGGSGDDWNERQRRRQRNHIAGERSRFHLGVDRRHPATCFESETIDRSCNGDFPFDVPCERHAPVVPLFYRLSRFENTLDHLTWTTIETRVTPQYYRYWHPNTV